MTPTTLPSSGAARVARAALFVASAVPLGAAALAVLVAGWSVTLSLAVTPLVVPAAIAFAATVGLLARAETGVARFALGASMRPSASRPPVRGYWRRGWAAVSDPRFWRAQAYLALRIVVGWPLAFAWLGLVAAGVQGVAAPLTYRWIPQEDEWHGFDLGVRRIDTLRESFVLVPIGLAVLALALFVVGPLARSWRRPAETLLGGNMEPVPPPAPADPVTRPVASRPAVSRRGAVVIHALSSAAVIALLVTIWALTTRGYPWPAWPALVLGLAVGIHGWVTLVDERRADLARRRVTPALAVHAGVSAAIVVFLCFVWALAGGGYVWPVWVLVGLAIPVGIHWLASQRQRIVHLESARTDAVAVQETDLRRIERDLHDGAQARLVALGMHLGLAEQKLANDPEGARQLVTEARQGVGEALQELRDLVRGIRPPVLADRGLEAAIAALADRSPIPVDVVADVHPRPADPVETAAYFVVAESLANAAKHAGATRVDVRLERLGSLLRVEVIDDGRGAADARGSGLTGLRQRVEALDGTFAVTSPPGGPTIVRAELPCGS
jgi:signal transduction histidine kinase